MKRLSLMAACTALIAGLAVTAFATGPTTAKNANTDCLKANVAYNAPVVNNATPAPYQTAKTFGGDISSADQQKMAAFDTSQAGLSSDRPTAKTYDVMTSAKTDGTGSGMHVLVADAAGLFNPRNSAQQLK